MHSWMHTRWTWVRSVRKACAAGPCATLRPVVVSTTQPVPVFFGKGFWRFGVEQCGITMKGRSASLKIGRGQLEAIGRGHRFRSSATSALCWELWHVFNKVVASSRELIEDIDPAWARLCSVGNCGIFFKTFSYHWTPDGWQVAAGPLWGLRSVSAPPLSWRSCGLAFKPL